MTMDIAKKYAEFQFGKLERLVFANAQSKNDLHESMKRHIIHLQKYFGSYCRYAIRKIHRRTGEEVLSFCSANVHDLLFHIYGDQLSYNMYNRTMEYENGVFCLTYYDHIFQNEIQAREFPYECVYVYPDAPGFDTSEVDLRIQEQKEILKSVAETTWW